MSDNDWKTHKSPKKETDVLSLVSGVDLNPGSFLNLMMELLYLHYQSSQTYFLIGVGMVFF